jgi:hypothetical protein
LKLSSLFAKFLYQHKELKLPGIGIFSLDPSVSIPDVQDKNFTEFLQHITYVQKPVANADEEFINFIRTETGKIKPLAESDLDSFLSDGKILLNIGKPFQLEGIGYLQKISEGNYEFKPGEPVLQRMENIIYDRSDDVPRNKPYFSEAGIQGNNLRKILIAGGAIAGIIAVVWLGYILYNKNTSKNALKDTIAVAPADTANKNVLLDSVQRIIDSEKAAQTAAINTASAPGTYKFVIEKTPNKMRALRRYNQLRNSTSIKMETKDSTSYNLYFTLPALASDTARIRDSLINWYGRKGVFVER